ncbi:MAG: hypothetical protein QXU20_02900 [Candidatus Woesearchaeota archaeon]
MLRVVLIGPGDFNYHYFNLLKISREKFYKQIEEVAKALKEANVEIILVPDRGVSFEVAKI